MFIGVTSLFEDNCTLLYPHLRYKNITQLFQFVAVIPNPFHESNYLPVVYAGRYHPQYSVNIMEIDIPFNDIVLKA
jgi:hypothetical protein